MAKWYGSVINRIIENAPAPTEVKPGDGATLIMYSDRHAYTVRTVDVSKSGKTVTITAARDNARRIDNLGMSDSQDWEYTEDPKAPAHTFVSRNGGAFRQQYIDDTGSKRLSDQVLRVGRRDEHYDYSF